MKIVIKALRIATIIFWIIILFFAISAVYSVMNLGVEIGEVKILPSSEGVLFSLPFLINNSGFYEIADLNLTTKVVDFNGNILDITETLISSLPPNTLTNTSHGISIALEEIVSINQTSLLLEDNEFNVELFVGLNFARAIPVTLSTNSSIPWGAPLANFSIGSISAFPFNNSHQEVTIPFSFENHAIMEINGNLNLELYDNFDKKIASGNSIIRIPPRQNYNGEISLYIKQEDLAILTNRIKLRFIFETPVFTIEWEEQYG